MSDSELSKTGDFQRAIEGLGLDAKTWMPRIKAEAEKQRTNPAHRASVLAKYWPTPQSPETETINQTYSEDQAERHEALLAGALERWGVGFREREILMAGCQPTHAIKAVMDFVASDRDTLVLSGGHGSGKTIAAAQWLVMVCNGFIYFGEKSEYRSAYWNPKARFTTVHDLARFGYFGDRAEKAFDLATRATFLVLDDLGAEYSADGWNAQLDSILNHRSSNKRKTLVTTNMSGKELARYGSRVLDRLHRNSVFVSVEFSKTGF